jgi:hypothetical protein
MKIIIFIVLENLRQIGKKIIQVAQKNTQCLPTILGLGFRV